MDKGDLADLFRELYRTAPPPYIHRAMLLRAVAQQLQIVRSGGPDRTLERRLTRLAEELRQQGSVTPERPSIKAGTQLLRHWQGETHTVTAIERGFRYRGEEYSSLTAIARKITGTAWSGPVFFGLRRQGNP